MPKISTSEKTQHANLSAVVEDAVEPAAEPAPTVPTSTIPDSTAEQLALTQILFDTAQSMSGGVGGTAVKSDSFKRVKQQSPDVHVTKTALVKAWKALVSNGCLSAVTGGTAVLNRAALSPPPVSPPAPPPAPTALAPATVDELNLGAGLGAEPMELLGEVHDGGERFKVEEENQFRVKAAHDEVHRFFLSELLPNKATTYLLAHPRSTAALCRGCHPGTTPATCTFVHLAASSAGRAAPKPKPKATAPAQPDVFDVRLPTGEDIRLPRGLCVENACTFSTALVVREMCTDCGHHAAATCMFIHLDCIMVGGQSVRVAELLVNVGLLCHLMTRPLGDHKCGFCTKGSSCHDPLSCKCLHRAAHRKAPQKPRAEGVMVELGHVVEATKAVEAYCYKLARDAGLAYATPKKLLQLCNDLPPRLHCFKKLFTLRNELLHCSPDKRTTEKLKEFKKSCQSFARLLPAAISTNESEAASTGIVATCCQHLEQRLRHVLAPLPDVADLQEQSLGYLVDIAELENIVSAKSGGVMLLAQLRVLAGLRVNALHAHPLGTAPSTCPLAFKHLCEACMKGLHGLTPPRR